MARGVWNAAFLRLMAFEALIQVGMSMTNPIVSNHAVALGASIALAGFLAGIQSLSSFVLRVFAGPLLRGVPRIGLLRVSAVAFAASALLGALAPNAGILGLSRVVMGGAFVVKSAIVVSLAASVATEGRMGQSVAWVALLGTVANALGPAVSSYMGTHLGYGMSFWVSAAVFIGAVAASFFLVDPDESEIRAASENRRRGAVFQTIRPSEFLLLEGLPIAGVASLATFTFGAVTYLMLLVGEQRGLEHAPLFFVVFATTTLLVRPVSSRLYDRLGIMRVYAPMVLLMCAADLLLMETHGDGALALGALCLGMGYGSLYPCLQAESVRGVDPENSVFAANTFYFGADAGMFFGPLVCGAVMDYLGNDAMFLALLLITLALFVACGAYAKWRKTHLK